MTHLINSNSESVDWLFLETVAGVPGMVRNSIAQRHAPGRASDSESEFELIKFVRPARICIDVDIDI